MKLLALLIPISFLASPVLAKSAKPCNDRCEVQYHFCLNRTTTKKGRSVCKAMLKTCRRSCRG